MSWEERNEFLSLKQRRQSVLRGILGEMSEQAKMRLRRRLFRPEVSRLLPVVSRTSYDRITNTDN
jgi:hypothetical protein